MEKITVTTPKCVVCNASASVQITPEEYSGLVAGGTVQEVLSNYDADFRELFISGTHSHCWYSLFGDE